VETQITLATPEASTVVPALLLMVIKSVALEELNVYEVPVITATLEYSPA
jgi:hypothetical protein